MVWRAAERPGKVVAAVTFLRLIPIDEYGFGAEKQPRPAALANWARRIAEMTTWGLCTGSTGRAQRSRTLPAFQRSVPAPTLI